MPEPHYSPVQLFGQRILSSRPVTWVMARTLHHVDRPLMKLTNGRTSLTAILSGFPMVTLTTIGAKSGQPRTVPLVGIPDMLNPGRFVIIASNWGQQHYPAWYFNLKANPRATCLINGHTGEYIAAEASGEEYVRFWKAAADIYLGYSRYKQRVGERGIPVMILTPVKE